MLTTRFRLITGVVAHFIFLQWIITFIRFRCCYLRRLSGGQTESKVELLVDSKANYPGISAASVCVSVCVALIPRMLNQTLWLVSYDHLYHNFQVCESYSCCTNTHPWSGVGVLHHRRMNKKYLYHYYCYYVNIHISIFSRLVICSSLQN